MQIEIIEKQQVWIADSIDLTNEYDYLYKNSFLIWYWIHV